VNYVKVESSQIAEVGFGEGHYGPETLGIIFNPSKKQLAANLPGSEYHYGGVTSRTYQTIVAAPEPRLPFSEIKSRADLYPYVKVEADPTEPNGSTPTATVGTKTQADGNSIPIGTTDILSPGSALALIDSMADDILFTPGAITDAQLAAGRQWYLTEAKKYDISTEPKRTELKRFARPLQKLRTGIEARAKELTGATKRKIAAIDAEKRRLVQIVGGIEDEVLRPLTEWESKEMTRVDEHAEALKAIRESILYGATETVTDLTIRLAWLEIQRKRDWQEFAVPAEHSINEEVSRVERLIDLADARDKEQSELAKLRSDAAARADADRLANAAKEAREQAERESKAAVEYAEQKRLAAEQETKRQAELAEQRAIETAAQAKRDQEQAIENERMRVAVEAKRKREEDEARAADDDHRCMVNKEAIDAIAKHLSVEWDLANTIVSAIAAGLIPHVKIEY
jgi:colicin import membrane protein